MVHCLSTYLLKIMRIRVASVSLTHLCMAPHQILALLPMVGHKADKDNITGASRLYGAGMHSEVLKHIENKLEQHMVDPGVTLLVQ